jgi:hypothetical protein
MQMPQEMQLKLGARRMSTHKPHNASANTSTRRVPPQGSEALDAHPSWTIKTNVKLYELHEKTIEWVMESFVTRQQRKSLQVPFGMS